MAINVNVQYNGGLLPDIILLTQCHLHWGTCLNVMKKRGATTRGCSGGRGSDDTRGYGVGSGDVGKELPRGCAPVNIRRHSRLRNWVGGCRQGAASGNPVNTCPYRADLPVAYLETGS